MNRRVDFNHGLLYAAELANERALPLLYYEGLTCSYPYASDRLHSLCWKACRVPTAAGAARHRIRFPSAAEVQGSGRRFLPAGGGRGGGGDRRLSTLSPRRHQRERSFEARHSVLRGGFELHRANEPILQARVRGLQHSSEDPEAAPGILTARCRRSSSSTSFHVASGIRDWSLRNRSSSGRRRFRGRIRRPRTNACGISRKKLHRYANSTMNHPRTRLPASVLICISGTFRRSKWHWRYKSTHESTS